MKKIAILTHKMPDYDAICSVMALTKLIRKNYLDVEVYPLVEPNELKNIDNPIVIYSIDNVKNVKFDYAVVCDVNDYKRCYGSQLLNQINYSNRFLIDHHDSNQEELDIDNKNKIVLGEMSSTCQILYRLFSKKTDEIDKDVLQNLFMGIASDTSSFTNSKTNIALTDTNYFKLNEQEKETIIKNVNVLSDEQLLLLSKIESLGNLVEGILFYQLEVFEEESKIIPLLKNPAFYQKTFFTVDNPVSIFIIKTSTKIIIKFRKSLDCDFDIIYLASDVFHGGGHNDRCNGYLDNGTIDEALAIVIEEVKKLQKHNIKKLQK